MNTTEVFFSIIIIQNYYLFSRVSIRFCSYDQVELSLVLATTPQSLSRESLVL
jgi:hypothetical protein